MANVLSRYHIVRGNLDSTEVLAKERIRTLQGSRRNGVIHVIDRVVLPNLVPDSDNGSDDDANDEDEDDDN